MMAMHPSSTASDMNDRPSLTAMDETHRTSITTLVQPRVRVSKKLIVCCDGTWMDRDNGWDPGRWGSSGHLQNPSNVTRLARAIRPEDDGHHPQIAYYQAGVGTSIGLYDQLVGGGTGLGLSENIREAYAFLASNYSEHDQLVPHDSIFLVGFSRGAFTARSIAGLIGAIGVLKRHAMPHFYEIFKDWENAGNPNYQPIFFDNYFKVERDVDKFCPDIDLAHDKTKLGQYMDQYRDHLIQLSLTQEARVKCVGVWDTVGALGIPINPIVQKTLPFLPSFIREYKWFDTRLDNHIDNAFHALALDERRFPFSPALWERVEGCRTNLKQVWFPGAHSNVGGSVADYSIADVSLVWMMDQLAGNTRDQTVEFDDLDWIRFDDDLVEHFYDLRMQYYDRHNNYQPWALGKLYDSLRFPQSLLGARVRHPGGYYRTFYETGNQDERHPLQNTQEYMHASVRVRMDLGGTAVEPDWQHVFPRGLGLKPLFQLAWHKIQRKPFPASYRPTRCRGPMEGWTLVDGHKSHAAPNMDLNANGQSGHAPAHEVKWVYEGNDPEQKGKVILEDKLGRYERMMLQFDRPLAYKVETSNRGRFGILRRTEHQVQPSRTI
ncbi:hypothetical protein K431DRAFT_288659 [Polychaeton citri CBS 116435]|uniref:T6SS Phospholipase effector Tle1-like catalytic domain-containing protein n=1 Tax=Polychaeton citri CBS 116435 TaxID=1314669 RepID=A0A9P4Q046_9PEZI|nr:hypothetical protein K431DRAFT_288659 [Polychaeton citri CBS 116435]